MQEWYRAVCDEHRECCTIFVAGHKEIVTAYPEDAREAAMTFLSDHWTCQLRLFRDEPTPPGYTNRTPP